MFVWKQSITSAWYSRFTVYASCITVLNCWLMTHCCMLSLLLLTHGNGDLRFICYTGGAREPARRRGEQPGVRGEPAAPGPRVRLHGRHPHPAAAGSSTGDRARRRQGWDRQAQVPPLHRVGGGGHRAPLVARLAAPSGLGGQPGDARRQQVGGDKNGSFGGGGGLLVVIGGVRRRRVELNGLQLNHEWECSLFWLR